MLHERSEVFHVNRVRLKRNHVLVNEQESLQGSFAEDSYIIAHDSKEADIEISSELDNNFETIRKAPSWLMTMLCTNIVI